MDCLQRYTISSIRRFSGSWDELQKPIWPYILFKIDRCLRRRCYKWSQRWTFQKRSERPLSGQKTSDPGRRLLFTSGGKLEMPKCLVYLMIHDFHNGELVIQRKDSILSQIKLNCSATGTETNIKLLEPDESHKTLGTIQNPLSDPKGQIELLKKKETLLGASFNNMRNRPKYQVIVAYHSFFISSLHFPLGVTLMNEKETKNISKRSTRAIIGALGVNWKFPRVIAHAPTTFMGLGLKSMSMDQWSKQIIQLLMHVNQSDENGKLYQMSTEYFQLISGTALPLLEYPKTNAPHLNDRFINGLRLFLLECNLFIRTDFSIPKPQREHDRCIMDNILKIEKSATKLRLFNQVRLFLKVFWLSDITNVRGDAIESTYLQSYDSSNWPSFSILFWPRQGYPNSKAWKTWVFLIRKTYMTHKLGRLGNLELENSLGNFAPRDK